MAQFKEFSIGDLVSTTDQWMCRVNDALLGQCRKTTLRGVKWCTPELDVMRWNLRRFRKRFQRGRRSNIEDLVQHRADYRTYRRTYINSVKEYVKKDDWELRKGQ